MNAPVIMQFRPPLAGVNLPGQGRRRGAGLQTRPKAANKKAWRPGATQTTNQ